MVALISSSTNDAVSTYMMPWEVKDRVRGFDDDILLAIKLQLIHCRRSSRREKKSGSRF